MRMSVGISIVVSLLLSFAVGALPNPAFAASQQTVFQKVIPTHPKPNQYKSSQFNATAGTNYTLTVINGTGDDLNKKNCKGLSLFKRLACEIENIAVEVLLALRVDSADIKLNGTVVASASQINKNVKSYSRNITLTATNKIEVKSSGSRLSYVKVKITKSTVQPPVNIPPVANVTFSVGPNNVVSFDGSTSIDSDGTINSYDWSFGDGQTASGILVSHAYATAGTFNATLRVTDNQGAAAEKTVAVTIIPNTAPIADFVVNRQQGEAPLMVTFNASSSTDAEGSLIYEWNFGNGQTATGVSVTHEFVNPGDYNVILKVTDIGGLSAQKTGVINVISPSSVPDPVQVAPIVTSESPSSTSDLIKFLYTGTDPIQTGVALDAIQDYRATLIRGRVLNREGSPISEVKLSVFDRPELGVTSTRNDGRFDFVVNGGGRVILTYEKNGYLKAQRNTAVPYNDFIDVGDVVLVRPDTKVTEVALGSSLYQLVEGSQITDSSGMRSVDVLIPAGTTAELLMPNGSRQSVQTLSVRLTEYTVGSNGPSAMPAALPPQSAYTYAFELSADEAVAAGADHIEFSQPVPFYVDNFLNFPVGVIVPIGVYDSTRGVWDAARNGVVMRVDSVNNGVASLVLNVQNTVATQAELDAYGITIDELRTIGSKYSAGQTLWRGALQKFSAVDCNWAFADNGNDPNLPRDGGDDDDRKRQDGGMCLAGNSVVHADSRSVSEVLEVVGTDFNLIYHSDRVAGNLSNNTFVIPISNATTPQFLKRIELTIEVAGRVLKQTFQPAPNLSYEFVWDGKDVYDRDLNSTQLARARVEYVYDAFYVAGIDPTATYEFGQPFTGLVFAQVPARSETRRAQTFFGFVGTNLKQNSWSLGGWTLDQHHFYDKKTKTLHLGSGESRRASDSGYFIDIPRARHILVGDPLNYIYPPYDGQYAFDEVVKGSYLSALAKSADGGYYLADGVYIHKIEDNGKIRTIAGNGVHSALITDVPALETPILANSMAESPSGELYFYSELGDFGLYKIDKNGYVRKIAGNGSPVDYYTGDGGPAINAGVWVEGGSLVFGADGSLYFVSRGSIRRISPNGIISTIAGRGLAAPYGYSPDGVFAKDNTLSAIFLYGMNSLGELVFHDTAPGPGGDYNRARKIKLDGKIETIAGSRDSGGIFIPGDGNVAENSKLEFYLECGGIGPDDTVYICGNHGIRAVTADGIINTVAGQTPNGSPFPYAEKYTQGMPATDGDFSVKKIAVLENGNIVTGSLDLIKGYGGMSTLNANIPSSDGSEIYVFDEAGRHLETKTSRTGASKLKFEYDTNGYLIAVRDAYNNVTQIQRSGANLTSITSPYGQVTELASDADGNLNSLRNPNNEQYQMSYQAGGLLTSFRNPRNAVTTLNYDAKGKLSRDQNILGGYLALTSTESFNLYNVPVTTAEGRVTQVSFVRNLDGSSTVQEYDAAGFITQKSFSMNNRTLTLVPSGVESTVKLDPTARLGNGSSFVGLNVTKMPSGLTREIAATNTSAVNDAANPFNFTETIQTTINGRISESRYDGLNRKWITTSPAGRVQEMTLDQNEKMVSAQVSDLAAVDFSYDEKGRLSVLSVGNRQTVLAYDNLGRIQSTTDAIGRTTAYQYDNAGRVTRKIMPDSSLIDFSYDSAGNLTSIAPSGRPVHEFSYDLLNYVRSYLPPSVSGASTVNTQYEYNLDKQLTRILRPDGQQAVYNYDQSSGYLLGVQTSTGNYSYGYSSTTGQLIGMQSPDAVTSSIVYDGDLIMSETMTGALAGQVNFNYNNDFLVSSVQVGTSVISNQYDADNLLIAAGAMTYSYATTNSLMMGSALGSMADIYGYNNFGEVTSVVSDIGGSTLFSLNMNRDDVGRVSAKTENIVGETVSSIYTYDLQGRLKTVDRNGLVNSYNYDGNGNRTSAVVEGVSVSAVYDNQDRLISYGSNGYGYNANGKRISKTNGSSVTQYGYDVYGNLKSVVLPSGSRIDYVLDARMRRVGRKVNGMLDRQYIYQNQLQIAAELDGSSNIIARYVYGSKANVPDYMVKGGVTYRLLSDQVGSVRLVVNAQTGAIAQRMDYDEFGRVLTDSAPGFQAFGFAGGLYEASSGLVHFGAREYDSEVGRWLSKDPIGFSGGDTNLYGYVANDPVNWTDPSGLARGDWWDPRTYVLPVVEAGQGATDFARNYSNMRQANTIGADKYFHCMANCQATQRGPGGYGAAVGISEGREFFDQYVKGDSANACNADRAANSQGRDGAGGGACSQVCGSLRPGGLGSQW